MSRYASSSFWCTAVAVVLVGGGVYAEPAEQNPTGISVVQALCRAAFPELMRERLLVLVMVNTEYDQDWTSGRMGILLRAPSEPLGELDTPSQEQRDAQLLGGFFHMIRVDGLPRVSIAHFSGRHVHSADLRTMKAALEADRPKTDAEVAARLSARGAKYGPDQHEAFSRDLNVERFGSALGRVTDHEVTFFWHQVFEGDGTRETREDIVEPRWLVYTTNEGDTGRRICHILAFEPFDGRLTSVQRIDCKE